MKLLSQNAHRKKRNAVQKKRGGWPRFLHCFSVSFTGKMVVTLAHHLRASAIWPTIFFVWGAGKIQIHGMLAASMGTSRIECDGMG